MNLLGILKGTKNNETTADVLDQQSSTPTPYSGYLSTQAKALADEMRAVMKSGAPATNGFHARYTTLMMHLESDADANFEAIENLKAANTNYWQSGSE